MTNILPKTRFQERTTYFLTTFFSRYILLGILLTFVALSGNARAADVPLTSGTPFPTSVPGKAIAKNLYIEVPQGSTKLTVTLTNGTGDLDLYLKYGRRLQGDTVNQLDADTDFISDGPTASESIVVTPSSNPPLKAGRWYIGTLNLNSSTTHFTVTASVEMPTSPPPSSGNSQELSNALFSNVKDLEAHMYLSGLSPSQEAFVKKLGYPTQFIKIFSTKNDNVRIDETWIYLARGSAEIFVNGIFINEEKFENKVEGAPQCRFRPENYNFTTTLNEIISRHGSPVRTEKETIGSKEFKTYIYDGILFGFLNGQIVSVTAGK